MNNKTLVRLSNIIGIISIVLLIYWVFTFISIEVFGFRVFRKNMTNTFYMSILGILALMAGALIINIMFNLTRIAEKHNIDELKDKRRSNRLIWIFALSFPLMFGLLYAGDRITSKKKEKMLISSAESIIKDNTKKANILANYSCTLRWVREAAGILSTLSDTDKNFPHLEVIVKDSINGSDVFLSFDRYYGEPKDSVVAKERCIYKTNKEEREYLNKIFKEGNKDYRYSASDGSYELYYPYFSGNKKIVLYFSEYMRYGKSGS